ncbi:MAG: hypothetical protein ACHP7N_10025 [Caulobacterales bacterium]
MKKLMIAAAALTMAAAPLAASAEPFGGHDGRGGWQDNRGGGWRGDRGGNGGAALAAGLFGLVVGSAIANAHDNEYGYAQPYGYGDYGPRCVWQSRPFVGPYGGVHYETVRVCR